MIIVTEQTEVEAYISDQGFLCLKSECLECGKPRTILIQPELIETFMQRLVKVANEAGKKNPT